MEPVLDEVGPQPPPTNLVEDGIDQGVCIGGARHQSVSSTISSPCSQSPPRPIFFSRDAKQKKKRGRPPKRAQGRPNRKGSLSKEGASSVSRELFAEGEHMESSRGLPEGHGAANFHLAPFVASGTTSLILSTIAIHGEGDPSPSIAGVGTTQGACYTTQLVGMQSSSVPLLLAPDLGLPSSLVGPSDSFIAKHVLSDGKVLGVVFHVEDPVAESRLVALEARDGAAKAAMGESRDVP